MSGMWLIVLTIYKLNGGGEVATPFWLLAIPMLIQDTYDLIHHWPFGHRTEYRP
jgi:hypothetical protein